MIISASCPSFHLQNPLAQFVCGFTQFVGHFPYLAQLSEDSAVAVQDCSVVVHAGRGLPIDAGRRPLGDTVGAGVIGPGCQCAHQFADVQRRGLIIGCNQESGSIDPGFGNQRGGLFQVAPGCRTVARSQDEQLWHTETDLGGDPLPAQVPPV